MLVDQRILERITVGGDEIPVQHLADRLRYHEFFSLFPAELRRVILSKAITKIYQPGQMVYQRGDTDAYMGVVVSGRLRMSMNASDGRGVLLGLVESDEVFGETTLLDGLPRTTDAYAEAETILMIIRSQDFLPALQTNPEAMFGVIRMLCHRLRLYVDTIDLIALQNLAQRLARLLLRLAGDYGQEENGLIVIKAKLNQLSLGQKLATSRESVNKQLKAFAAEGFIAVHGDEITLLNVQAIHNIAGS